MAKSELYKAAGVDIDLATTLLDRVKADLGSTRRPEMLTPIGGFGGLFQIDLTKYKEPVMVASIDGVGTKLMVAAMMEKYDTVGMDIVNHCINDISVQGAEPVYFLDYIGIGKLRSPLYEEVLSDKENTKETPHPKINVAAVREYNYAEVLPHIELLTKYSTEVRIPEMVIEMKEFVPEFKSKNSVYEMYDKK